uniref:Transmembrane protein n=1 Tax=Marseillevirus LCMAC103 TaxID=2506604 RepID=A0A481YUP1_9VIRU|nr:MAG: hypothetical protein LCMAC103_02400 [Marseillevirus LCMAC103]
MQTKCVLAVLGAVWAWETIAIGRGHAYRPSSPLVWAADTAYGFFEAIGRTIAYVSGLLFTWIDVYEIGMALVALTEPVLRLLMSPFRIVYGYVWELAVYHNKWFLVILGTATLAACALAVACAWRRAEGPFKPKPAPAAREHAQ